MRRKMVEYALLQVPEKPVKAVSDVVSKRVVSWKICRIFSGN